MLSVGRAAVRAPQHFHDVPQQLTALQPGATCSQSQIEQNKYSLLTLFITYSSVSVLTELRGGSCRPLHTGNDLTFVCIANEVFD